MLLNNSKTTISISRGFSISPKSYDLLKPYVSLTFKDVDITKLEFMYPSMNNILDNLVQMELVQQYVVYNSARKKGLDDFCVDIIKNRLDDMKESLSNSIEKLNGILGDDAPF